MVPDVACYFRSAIPHERYWPKAAYLIACFGRGFLSGLTWKAPVTRSKPKWPPAWFTKPLGRGSEHAAAGGLRHKARDHGKTHGAQNEQSSAEHMTATAGSRPIAHALLEPPDR
jgi:hypothetical protein